MTFTLDGHRSLAVEVQSLVTNSVLPTRAAPSWRGSSRIAMLVAVLYRHGGISLLQNDLYISTIAGGQAKEPGCDLAITAAMASAALNKPIAKNVCAIGEISLTGQVRPVPRLEYRLREAQRLGVHESDRSGDPKAVRMEGMTLAPATNLKDALAFLHLAKQRH